MQKRRTLAASLGILFVIAAFFAPLGVRAQDVRAYDQDLLRLSEILGSIHYLRALCGFKDGQLWRDQMQALVKAESTSALRRVVLVRRFNRGYQNYSRTYRNCTVSAKTAVQRFLEEADKLSEKILQDGRPAPRKNETPAPAATQ